MYTALEQRIIAKASELFLLRGIKAVTMDFLATEMGISKRTLYERFKDKETLLRKTLEYQDKKSRQEREKLAKECTNPLELNLMEYKAISDSLRRINRNYIRDLQKYHPQIADYFTKKRETDMEKVVSVMEKSIQEGYIRAELNPRILALLLRVQLETLIYSEEIEKNHFSYPEVFETIVLNYARGIATPKGLELIEDFMEKMNH
ncbi:TetR/AcrR family transcriptional regulator [Odoribacter laneus]|uniref:TetR/AcrR family transcriptional regulator n=1 Tax=Odoribacter laneus TaxID=626933 RepID=UPI003AF465B4